MRAAIAGWVVCLVAVPGSAGAVAPWEAGPFEARPADVLAAAQALEPPADADVDILMEEVHVSYDAQGRSTWRRRLVTRILSPRGVEQWGTTEVDWAPWNEDRSVLRARVIRPGGQVLELDPSTIVENAGDSSSALVLRDRRVLRAPLPGLVPGAVVEEQGVEAENEPQFAAGMTGRFWMGGNSRTVRLERLILEAPASLPLSWAMHGGSLKPVRTVDGANVRLVFEARDVKPVPYEDMLPPDRPAVPHVVWTRARSWNEVARAYHAMVEEALGKRSLRKRRPAREVVAEALARLRADVRYTGLSLG